jgi:hypothetical protein
MPASNVVASPIRPLMDVAAAQVFDALAMCVCSRHGSRLSKQSSALRCQGTVRTVGVPCGMLALVSSFVSRVPSLFRPEAETHRPLDSLTNLRPRIRTSSIWAVLETFCSCSSARAARCKYSTAVALMHGGNYLLMSKENSHY